MVIGWMAVEADWICPGVHGGAFLTISCVDVMDK